jgi:hypothetical protein
MGKICRNEICKCGSGKKYKKCCINNEQESNILNLKLLRTKKIETEISDKLLRYLEKNFPEAQEIAWEEFFIYENVPSIDDSIAIVHCAFLPWLLYNWTDDDECQIEEGKTIAESYLLAHGMNVTKNEREIILAHLKINFSIYEVMHVIKHQSIKLRDILRDKIIIISEKKGTEVIKMGDVILARIVEFRDVNLMLGLYPRVLKADFIAKCVDLKQHYKNEENFTDEDLYEYDFEIRELFINNVNQVVLPKLQNTDGEAIVPSQVMFNLRCKNKEALDKLACLAYIMEKEELLEDAIYDEHNQLESVIFSWSVAGNKVHQSWSNTIYGEITISNNQVVAEVNSVERAKKIKAEIERLLGDKAEYRDTIYESIEQRFSSKSIARNENEDDMNEEDGSEEAKELLEEMQKIYSKHYEEWLDMNVPSLDGRTPRKASKSKMGLEKLEALFSMMHQENLRQSGLKNGGPLIDIAFLRKELGMN